MIWPFIRNQYRNYFHTPALYTWWGHPVWWESAVVAIAAICAVALFLPIPPNRRLFFRAWLISAPLIFGLAATVFQIHMIFYTLTVSGWAGPGTSGRFSLPWDDIMFCDLFSSHIGLFSSIGLLLLSLASKAFLRANHAPAS